MKKKYSKMQLEDKALKSAAMYFGQELLPFEFESVEINKDDLYRFRMYDAYTAMVYKRPVATYVW